MTNKELLNRLSLCLVVLVSLSFTACGDDKEVTDESMAGEVTAGEGTAGEGTAGETTAGEGTAGETTAGEGTAGETTAGDEMVDGGEMAAGGEMSGANEMMEEPFVCAQDILQIQTASVRPTPTLTYTGIDDRFNFSNIIQIEFSTEPVLDQTYTLDGQTPDNYEISILVGAQCTEDGCAEVYFVSAGELKFTELGASGQEIAFELSGLLLSRINRDNGSIDTSNQVCLSDQEVRVMRLTEVGDVIPEDFAVQNCETGDMVNVKEFGANAKGIWYFATAGWCPACRQTLTYLFAEVFPMFSAETIRPMIVVSEDDEGDPATLSFCRAYASRYTDSAVDFYVDASLDTTFSNIWAYFGDDGSFGLPWQAVIEGGTGVYLYADGAPGPDTVEDVINRLMAP
jgi:hypothetical protein